jgi:hypothetical protein
MKPKRLQKAKGPHRNLDLSTIKSLEAEWSFCEVPENERQACLAWEFWREAHTLSEHVRNVVNSFRKATSADASNVFVSREEAKGVLEILACYSDNVWPQQPFLKVNKAIRCRAWDYWKQQEVRLKSLKECPDPERWRQSGDFHQSLDWFCPPHFLSKNCPCYDFLGEQCSCAAFLSEWRKLQSGKAIVTSDFFDENRKFASIVAAIKIDLTQSNTAIVENFGRWLKELRSEVEPHAGFHTAPTEVGRAPKGDPNMRLLKGLGAIRLQRTIGSVDRILKAFLKSSNKNFSYEGGGLPAANETSWREFAKVARGHLDFLLNSCIPTVSILSKIKKPARVKRDPSAPR